MSVQTIFNMGDDALANLWDISIGTIPFLSDITATLLRVQNFNIPASGANTYEVHHKTNQIDKISGKVDSPKEFTFDVRIDRNYAVYKSFILWKNAVSNSYTGVIGPDNQDLNFRVPVDIWAIDANGDPLPGFGKWAFKACLVKNVGDVSLDYSSGDPITVTITMSTLGLDDSAL